MRSERTTTQDLAISMMNNDKTMDGFHKGSLKARSFLGRVSGLLLGLRLSDKSSDENDRDELDTLRTQVEHASHVITDQDDLITTIIRVFREMRTEYEANLKQEAADRAALKQTLIEVRASYEVAEDIQRKLRKTKDRLKGKGESITKDAASDQVNCQALRIAAIEGNLNSVIERIERRLA